MAKVTFNNKDSSFYDSVKARVEQYFNDNKIRQTGNSKLYIKTLTLIPAAIALYVTVVFFHINPYVALFLCALLGFTMASIGFNVMHDACHGSYSSKKWINNLLGLSINCMGGNAFLWKTKHNIIHHTYTNVDGIDDDIAKLPLIRQCESQKRMKLHKYQHFYTVIIYALASFLWVFLMDFIKYFGKKIYTTPIHKIEVKEHVIFWGSKILYVFFYIALPVYTMGAIPWLIGFFVMHVTMGIALAIVFQLAHVVEDVQFIDANSAVPQKIEQEWAVCQVRSTANFATKNKFVSWYVGGLNFQIEHHLFPKVSHVHYPMISSFVKQTCEEHGLKYVDYPTVSAAVASHFRFMKYLGTA